eukprot:TRINITY_DN1979_c0_g1_i1.p1 TRINITY_DN1979_c0_g1~~TRINITY_DN1979_c0_g1_i1.p1  ORF type:complete len:323 (-),score=46.05 TRINITY_DN1979_c0_g1_i1:187-1155(-)
MKLKRLAKDIECIRKSLGKEKLLKKSYEFFKSELNWHLSKEQQLSMFGHNTIKLSNFVYLTRVLVYAFRFTNNEAFLIPSYQFIDIFPLSKSKHIIKRPNVINYLNDFNDNTFKLNLAASEEIDTSYNIRYYQFIKNSELMITFARSIQANRQECLRIETVPDEIADSYNLEKIHCTDQKKVKQFYAMGILANMDEQEKYKCKKASRLEHLYFKENYKEIIRHCNANNWPIDIFTQPLKDLNEYQVYEMQFQEKILKYLIARGQKHLPVFNVQLILNYSQFYINLAKNMEKLYKEYKKKRNYVKLVKKMEKIYKQSQKTNRI